LRSNTVIMKVFPPIADKFVNLMTAYGLVIADTDTGISEMNKPIELQSTIIKQCQIWLMDNIITP